MDDLRACDHYRGAGDLYLRRRTCVGWGRGATHWVDRVGICGRLFFGLITYTPEFRWYNFESKNRDMPSISCFKFIVTIRNIFQQWKVKYEIKNWIFLTTTTKMTAVMSQKNELSIKNGRKNTSRNGHRHFGGSENGKTGWGSHPLSMPVSITSQDSLRLQIPQEFPAQITYPVAWSILLQPLAVAVIPITL